MILICANKDCSKEFEAKTHNQKYCNDECCRIATNKRIMEKYYEKKAIRQGAVRKCSDCSVKLSRYNDGNLCAICQKRKSAKEKDKNNLLRMINEVS